MIYVLITTENQTMPWMFEMSRGGPVSGVYSWLALLRAVFFNDHDMEKLNQD